MNIYEDFLERLDKAVALYGNKNQLAQKMGVAPSLITRWVKRERVPGLDSIQPFANLVGLFFAEKNESSNSMNTKEFEALRKENEELKITVKALHEALRQIALPPPMPKAPPADGASGKELLSLLSEQEKNGKAV